MPSLTEHDVVEWLKERRANCLRIADTKTGPLRRGWLEDAEYFEAAIMFVLGITEQDIYSTKPESLN
jgi:hypothetical protein